SLAGTRTSLSDCDQFSAADRPPTIAACDQGRAAAAKRCRKSAENLPRKVVGYLGTGDVPVERQSLPFLTRSGLWVPTSNDAPISGAEIPVVTAWAAPARTRRFLVHPMR